MQPDNSQAAPIESVTPSSAQVQEPITPTPVETPAEPQKETPLTLEDYRKIAREEATKIAQSQVAKGENRIQKLIQDKFAALNQTKDTLGLTDDQVKQAQQKIVTEAYASPEETPKTNQPETPETPDTDQAIQYMNAQITSVFRKAGQTVTKADPEFEDLQKAVDASWNNEDGLVEILLAANEAATKKAARLQASSRNASARVAGGGGSGTSTNTNNLTAEEKISMGLKNESWPSEQPTTRRTATGE
jgi:hypothetical protein